MELMLLQNAQHAHTHAHSRSTHKHTIPTVFEGSTVIKI